jgi:ABC-type antimicrobial peptide transport system permease subunit
LLWPNEPALGKVLQPDGEEPLTVVGVAGDVRTGYGRAVEPAAYQPFAPVRFGIRSIVARTTGDPSALGRAIRTAAQRLDPQLVVGRGAQLEAALSQSIASSRFETTLFGLFGLLGVVVAAIGVYGLIAAWVGARTRELGVRLALGADGTRLKRFVLKQASIPLLAGVAMGLGGALALGKHLRSLLYEITPYDPVTLATAVAVLLAVGLGAVYLPARRAARVDPVITLRTE